jgi:hypothetical protein
MKNRKLSFVQKIKLHKVYPLLTQKEMKGKPL